MGAFEATDCGNAGGSFGFIHQTPMDCQPAAMLGLDLKLGIHNCVPVMVWWPIPYRVAIMMSGWRIKMTIVATTQEYEQGIFIR